ncbi:MAG: hypothetical protein ACE5K0_10015 [Candidatus Methanofastidiosia archaeon]
MSVEFRKLGLLDKIKLGCQLVIHSLRFILSFSGFLLTSWREKRRARKSFEKTLRKGGLPSELARELSRSYEIKLRDFMRRGDGHS